MTPELFTAPWPGPGDSEGPPDPEGWVSSPSDVVEPYQWDDSGGISFAAWPGPGDSEAPVEATVG